MTEVAPDQAVRTDAVRRWLGCAELSVAGRPGAGGWSGETVFLVADGRPLVLRTAPARRGMFAEHDLGTQVRCLRHVRAHGLPAPEVVAADLAGEVLGRPAYVMERVPGRVPADDDPPFTRAGFLVDATVEERRRYSADLLDRIAELHRIPALPGLPVGPAPTDHLTWCTGQRAGIETGAELVEEARAVLASTAPPADGPVTQLWGDARPANTVVGDDFRVAALLDWELAGTGAPEFDIAWLLEMNRLRAPGGADPPLDGFLSEEQTWQRWTGHAGREPRARRWHHRFAAYRVVVLMDLHLADRVRRGELAADHPVRTDNRARRRLAALLAEG